MKAPHNFHISILTPDDKLSTEAFRVLADAFAEEPASYHLEQDRSQRLKGWQQFISHFEHECATNGMSVMCVDQDQNQVAAVLVLRDFTSPFPQLVAECIDQWKDPKFGSRCDYAFLGPLLEVLVAADEKYMTKCHTGGINQGTVADLWMSGTKKEYRHQGLLKACAQHALGLARDHGYKEAIGECTGHYSARAMKKLGAEPVASCKYRDFRLSNGQIGLKVAPPHSQLEILSFNLKE